MRPWGWSRGWSDLPCPGTKGVIKEDRFYSFLLLTSGVKGSTNKITVTYDDLGHACALGLKRRTCSQIRTQAQTKIQVNASAGHGSRTNLAN